MIGLLILQLLVPSVSAASPSTFPPTRPANRSSSPQVSSPGIPGQCYRTANFRPTTTRSWSLYLIIQKRVMWPESTFLIGRLLVQIYFESLILQTRSFDCTGSARFGTSKKSRFGSAEAKIFVMVVV